MRDCKKVFGPVAYSLVLMILLAASSCKKDLLRWQLVQRISSGSQTDQLSKVLFVNSLKGYVFGGTLYKNSVILTTSDGGQTWNRTVDSLHGELLRSGTIAPDGSVYTCGYEGKLYYAAQNNTKWNFHQMEDYWFRDLAFIAPNDAIVVGGISFASGLMLHIDSFGNATSRDSLTYQLNRIWMEDQSTGFICCYGFVMKTVDGGKTWVPTSVTGDNFTGIRLIGNDVWVCGYYGSIYHSPDNGASWDRLRNGNDLTQEAYRLNDLTFTDQLHGWAVGEGGKVVYSSDGGHHWSEYDRFTTATLFSIAALPDGSFVVCGNGGTLYKILP